MKIVACLLFCVLVTVYAAPTPDIVDHINGMKTTWKAKKYDPEKPMRLGVLEGPIKHPLKVRDRISSKGTDIPATFDARQKWPDCISSIGNIRNQGQCGSCWAVSSASVFSDRMCINSGGKVQTSFSGEDTAACCKNDGSDGCNGGYPDGAWNWYVTVGVVSGGNYTNKSGCRPYLFCSPTAKICETPACEHTCDGTLPSNDYNVDKNKAVSAYALPARDPEQMQLEVMTNGSIVVTFSVYEDFYSYESGVYQKTPGSPFVGLHAVRLIGWGTENGTPYWLIANSWGYDWGENGYFQILRGKDECGIEKSPCAGQVPTS